MGLSLFGTKPFPESMTTACHLDTLGTNCSAKPLVSWTNDLLWILQTNSGDRYFSCNSNIFIQENEFENVICKKLAILPLPNVLNHIWLISLCYCVMICIMFMDINNVHNGKQTKMKNHKSLDLMIVCYSAEIVASINFHGWLLSSLSLRVSDSPLRNTS